MRKDRPNIVEFTKDRQLLGLGCISEAQETLQRSIYGLPLNDSMRDIYHRCTGRSTYNEDGFDEGSINVGARGGKDSMIATPIASYEAVFGNHEKYLGKGEHAVIPLVAQNTTATKIAFGYIRDYFLHSDILSSMLTDEPLAGEISLKNGISIVCFPSTKSSLRGWSIPCGIMDEVAFFRLAGSADSDVEIQQSIRRGMINFPRTKLIKISTPYMKSGVLYDDFKTHWGNDDSTDVLVWRASSQLMNPTLTAERLERERRLDPLRYEREYEAQFIEGLDAFLADAWIEPAIARGVHERAPQSGLAYKAGCDSSGGSMSANADSFTLSICHAESEKVVQDVCRGWKKTRTNNVDLAGIVAEIATTLKRYGLTEITGDRYSAQWVVEAFHREGIFYRQSEKDKSSYYLELEPLFAQGRIAILDHPQVVRELKLLERHARPGGKTIVDHPRASHDDYANSLAIAAVNVSTQPNYGEDLGISVGGGSRMDFSDIGTDSNPYPHLRDWKDDWPV